MYSPKLPDQKQGKPYNLIAVAVLGGMMILPAAFWWKFPVFAQVTPAGTQIRNRATGTFEDPNNPGVPLDPVFSNEVILTVAEVAGITVQSDGISIADGGSEIDVGDLLYYRYEITNVGNDPTRFRIPNSATVVGSGSISGNLQFSVNGGTTWTEISGNEFTSNAFSPQESILVRVPVTVANSAIADDEITVTLGNTPNNAQNLERVADPTDVFTVDGADNSVAGETSGNPVNGTREASDTQTATVAGVPLALVALYKTHATPVEVNNPATPRDDEINYQLTLDVRSSLPPGSSGIVPSDLVATTGISLTVDGNTINRLLVSDAIPDRTTLIEDSWTAPTGWEVVFTDANPAEINAMQAPWTTDVETLGGMGNVTRIGFIFNGTIAAGTTVSGFEYKVVTDGVTGNAAIANIAQVFGATDGNPDLLVYDESGDQNPNNFNDDGTPPPTDSTENPLIGTGVANPGTDGQDPNNDNTGEGPGGEANVVPISTVESGIFSGPLGQPDAIGPTDDNDDFTNQVLPIPANLEPGETFTPPPSNFTNTVRNTTGQPITLAPTPPEDPNALPAGTTVTITYGGRSVTYVYDPATGFSTTDTPITIPSDVSPADYGVSVQLPNAEPNSQYPVPIAAFIDEDGDGSFDPTETGNTTINRIYTGFVEINKESRLLQGNGPDIIPGQDNFSPDPKSPGPGNIIEYRLTYNNFSLQGRPGNVTLDATDVVIVEDGTTYDPTTNPGGNNWALDTENIDGDNDPTTGIDTSHVVGSATDSRGGTVEFFSGQPATNPTGEQRGTTVDSDVTRYVVRVRGTLGPGESGTFTFQRQVN
ncbi:DUF7925 domain-containing protein [Phormidium sp. CCY1219]|uniref:DUF7925 domain-containing protein n=1 Tax=Phormidium sp. CCY1219 TaxID=2886104 RepID=UPI002D1F4ACC|nr:hypothetical protein [Phormidium sp. CCY1219]MEB3830990.1 hypothetical protein [Phormidium sp. CCY1219]